ncbi:MAG: hypothetical protein M3Y07_07795, partial [Acidobacteriota bacterium]|nr:hypothetical protein [Acidobacteriota bacterium]
MRQTLILLLCLLLCLTPAGLRGQEAASGFDLRATVSGVATSSRELTDETQSGSEVGAGFRTILYP